jgi:hypothetical protein
MKAGTLLSGLRLPHVATVSPGPSRRSIALVLAPSRSLHAGSSHREIFPLLELRRSPAAPSGPATLPRAVRGVFQAHGHATSPSPFDSRGNNQRSRHYSQQSDSSRSDHTRQRSKSEPQQTSLRSETHNADMSSPFPCSLRNSKRSMEIDTDTVVSDPNPTWRLCVAGRTSKATVCSRGARERCRRQDRR